MDKSNRKALPPVRIGLTKPKPNNSRPGLDPTDKNLGSKFFFGNIWKFWRLIHDRINMTEFWLKHDQKCFYKDKLLYLALLDYWDCIVRQNNSHAAILKQIYITLVCTLVCSLKMKMHNISVPHNQFAPLTVVLKLPMWERG